MTRLDGRIAIVTGTALVAQTVRELGAPHILINNTGIAVFNEPLAMPESDCARCMAVDLEGAWRCARTVLAHMLGGWARSKTSSPTMRCRS